MLAHWNNSPQIDMSPHSDTVSWFWANQSLLFLLNTACLVQNQKYEIYSLWFDPTGVESTMYRTWDEQANHYTNDTVA